MHFDKNLVKVTGEVVSEVMFAYEYQGISFVSFFVEPKRLSGAGDKLLVVAKKSVIPDTLAQGVKVSLEGSFRIYQNRFDCVSTRNAYVVYTSDIEIVDDATPDVNEITIVGYPVSVKDVRSTATGRSLREVVVATNKYYTKADGRVHSKAYYINCISWSNTLGFFNTVQADELIEIKGRIQSRTFTRNGEDREFIAYEVSVNTAEKFDSNKEEDTSLDEVIDD